VAHGHRLAHLQFVPSVDGSGTGIVTTRSAQIHRNQERKPGTREGVAGKHLRRGASHMDEDQVQ
jgi:hypothetical protein